MKTPHIVEPEVALARKLRVSMAETMVIDGVVGAAAGAAFGALGGPIGLATGAAFGGVLGAVLGHEAIVQRHEHVMHDAWTEAETNRIQEAHESILPPPPVSMPPHS